MEQTHKDYNEWRPVLRVINTYLAGCKARRDSIINHGETDPVFPLDTYEFICGYNMPELPMRWNEAHEQDVKTGIEIVPPNMWPRMINDLPVAIAPLGQQHLNAWNIKFEGLTSTQIPIGGLYLMSSSASPDARKYIEAHNIHHFISVGNYNSKKALFKDSITRSIGLTGKTTKGENGRILDINTAKLFSSYAIDCREWLVQGHNVAVYCKAGENRSVAFLLWLFMHQFKFTYLEALNFLTYRGVTFDKLLYNDTLRRLSSMLQYPPASTPNMNIPMTNIVKFRKFKDAMFGKFALKLLSEVTVLETAKNLSLTQCNIAGLADYIRYMSVYLN